MTYIIHSNKDTSYYINYKISNFYATYCFIIKDIFCSALVVAVTLTSVVILLIAPVDSTILSMVYPPVTDVAVLFLNHYKCNDMMVLQQPLYSN